MATTRTFKGVDATIDITAAKVLTAGDGGKHFVLRAAEGAAITLPDASSHFRPIKISTGALFATTAWTVVTPGGVNIIQGSVEVAGAVVVGLAEDTITFAHAADAIGDSVTVSTDGTSIFVEGQAALSGGITLTAT